MAHGLRGMTITIGAPELLNGNEGRRELAVFYCELLGMRIIREDWLKIAKDANSVLHLALDGDGWSDERPPRWGDPEHPQQMHLDISVPRIEEAGALVERLGGTLLQEMDHYRTYADPAGHPFCIFTDAARDHTDGPVIAGLTIDCFSPRSLAAFYEGLLGVHRRTGDTPERVTLSLEDPRFPDFSFQQSVHVAPRWPDPAFPAQLHVDFGFVDGTDAAVARAEQFGAIRLPKLADTEIFADPAGHPFCL